MYNTIDTKDTKDSLVNLRLTYLETLCQSHDWYYSYSDDHRVWTKGNQEREEITRVVRELRELGYNLEADEVLKKYTG